MTALVATTAVGPARERLVVLRAGLWCGLAGAVFVLTHHARAPLVMEGGTTFHFVTDGVDAALARAREAAKGKDVRVGGGVNVIQQYLRRRLIDEMHIAISPVLLGAGERTVCLAQANDWLNDQEVDDAAHKTRRWLQESPTPGQLRYLPAPLRADFSLTRYQVSALLTFQFNKAAIQRLVTAANDAVMAEFREAA